MQTDYQIAIPSYKRPERLITQTIATLQRHGIPLNRVTVFVANEAERLRYQLVADTAKLQFPIVISKPGLINSRIWYSTNYYQPGTPILNLDDDINDIVQKQGSRTIRLVGGLDRIIRKGFQTCRNTGAKLWGINAVNNGMFMDHTISIGLRYICGIFHGSVAGDPALHEDRILDSSGEDFETTLRSYRRYKGVVRLDGFAPITKYFAEGGIQAELGGLDQRAIDHQRALSDITKRHPGLATLYSESGDVPNIRLKRVTIKKIQWQ